MCTYPLFNHTDTAATTRLSPPRLRLRLRRLRRCGFSGGDENLCGAANVLRVVHAPQSARHAPSHRAHVLCVTKPPPGVICVMRITRSGIRVGNQQLTRPPTRFEPVRRESLGVVRRSRAILCRTVRFAPNESLRRPPPLARSTWPPGYARVSHHPPAGCAVARPGHHQSTLSGHTHAPM
jgi:hypothetical protein